jgi:hypothetical protein
MTVASWAWPILMCSGSPRNPVVFWFRMIEKQCRLTSRFVERLSSPGVIIVSQELDIGSAIEDLLLIWAATDAEEWIEHLGFVPL